MWHAAGEWLVAVVLARLLVARAVPHPYPPVSPVGLAARRGAALNRVALDLSAVGEGGYVPLCPPPRL